MKGAQERPIFFGHARRTVIPDKVGAQVNGNWWSALGFGSWSLGASQRCGRVSGFQKPKAPLPEATTGKVEVSHSTAIVIDPS